MKQLKQNNLTKQNNFTPFSKRMKRLKQNTFTKTVETNKPK
jgi:hypothetical protein